VHHKRALTLSILQHINSLFELPPPDLFALANIELLHPLQFQLDFNSDRWYAQRS
jgi:hypothetical protein